MKRRVAPSLGGCHFDAPETTQGGTLSELK
jgi:hypothetical protein